MAEKPCNLSKNGGGMELYSTSEMLVARLDDGTNVYRKIYNGTLSSPYSFAHGISNLGDIYRLDGFVKSSSTTRPLNLAYFGDASWDSALSITNTNLVIEAGSSFLNAHSGQNYVITVEYTKSS